MMSLGLQAITALVTAAAAPHGPVPVPVEVEIAAMNGLGCPPGSVAVEPGASGFTVRYGGFTARAGGGVPPTDARKSCQVNLKITVPAGFTYAVRGAEHRGSARLDAGAAGVLRARHYYAGVPSRPPINETLKGPFADAWRFAEPVGDTELVWVPCGEQRNLTLSTELRLSTGDASKTSVMDMNSALGTDYAFVWKTCPPGAR